MLWCCMFRKVSVIILGSTYSCYRQTRESLPATVLTFWNRVCKEKLRYDSSRFERVGCARYWRCWLAKSCGMDFMLNHHQRWFWICNGALWGGDGDGGSAWNHDTQYLHLNQWYGLNAGVLQLNIDSETVHTRFSRACIRKKLGSKTTIPDSVSMKLQIYEKGFLKEIFYKREILVIVQTRLQEFQHISEGQDITVHGVKGHIASRLEKATGERSLLTQVCTSDRRFDQAHSWYKTEKKL